MQGRKYYQLTNIISRIKGLLLLPFKLREIHGIAIQPSYYNKYINKRKSYIQRLIDNIIWYLKHQEVNIYYMSYALDIKKYVSSNDYLSIREFRYKRDYLNQYNTGVDYNYISILRDKVVFSNYYSQFKFSKSIIKNLAIINDGKFEAINSSETSIIDLLSNREKLVIKSINGECGNNVYFLKLHKNKIYVNNEVCSLHKFNEMFSVGMWVVQNYIIQCDELNKLNPYCVNTIRIITVINENKVRVFSSFLRLGIKFESKTDNRANGGISIGINDKGKLQKFGLSHPGFGGIYEKHPLTNCSFEGFTIPYWQEINDLVVSAHQKLKYVKSIGWDVAVSESGPVIIEANDNWEIAGPQDTLGGLKEKFYKFISH